MEFLTKEWKKQYALLIYIIENNIIYWEKINWNMISINSNYPKYIYYTNLDFFRNWIVGFTIAEGSFGLKKDGSAFYQIR